MSDQKELHWLLSDIEDGTDAEETTKFVIGAVRKQLSEQHNIDAPEKLDVEGTKRLNAETDIVALGRLQAMTDKSKRAIVYHTANVVARGDFRYAPGEPEDISDFLSQALDESEMSISETADLKFIAGDLVPYMGLNEIPNAAVLWASGYKVKSRAAVPLLRFLFSQAPPNLKSEVAEIIEWIVDPKKTVTDIQEKSKQKRGVTPPTPAYAFETILPNNRSRITIECDATQRGAIVKKLKNLIDLHLAEAKPDDDTPETSGVEI